MKDPLADWHEPTNEKPIKVANVLPPVMDEPMLPTKIKNLLALHGIENQDRLLTMSVTEFLSKWGLGWAAWQELVAYKRYRSHKDGVDYIELSRKK